MPSRASPRALFKRLAPQARGDAIVLLYHRIASPDHDPWGNCVARDRFDEQLDVVARRFRPISLRALAAGIEEGDIPPRSVCVTFDDGYRDNLYVAKPLLERHGVPATVFVVSGHVGSGREFWWDELARLCLEGELPDRLRLDPGGEPFEWSGHGDGKSSMPSWRAWRRPRTGRQKLYVSLYRRLADVDDDQRRRALDELAQLVKTGEPLVVASSAEEIRSLADGDLVEIGAHTISHPALRVLPVDRQRAEIAGAKAELERMLERPVEAFAYPHSSYDEHTIAAVRDAGYARACGGGATAVTAETSVFDIARMPATSWAGRELERQLVRYLDA